MFRRILIANRGEIACRVIATARRMGIATVAVFSEADAGARHTVLADEAWPIGPAPARLSYLNIAKIVEVARASGVEAVHPGYGFLSENADFAEACAAAGLIFIGPPPAAIRAMGSKADSKALMARAGVPLVPGYHGTDQSPTLLAEEAARIGFPVLIKASAGGGGKGMRVVPDATHFAEALEGAQREARASFSDDRVLIEKYLTRPRHIEIQVFADSHGNVVSLFERDCSIQRRHQKVIEEAPAPGMDPARRNAMGEAAVSAARAVGYVGAGTVEFIAEGGDFFFMEMNTRLQVEHPVTEMVTGLDLVEWQFRVAAGEALPLRKDQLSIRGHAIEARIYAEDPARDFLPSTGTLIHLRQPDEVLGAVRVDTGVRQGDAITPNYDPMIAKLIVHGEDRAAALRRLSAALAEYEVAGVTTNLPLLRAIAAHPVFAAGELDTGFIARHAEALLPVETAPPPEALAAAVLKLLEDQREALRLAAEAGGDPHSPWAVPDAWRLNGDGYQDFLIGCRSLDPMRVRVHPRGTDYLLDLHGSRVSGRLSDGGHVLHLDGVARRVALVRRRQEVTVLLGGQAHLFTLGDPLAPPRKDSAGSERVTAPIPGRITRVLVSVGDAVTRSAPLLVMEAMKMELTLRAPADGVVAAIPHGLEEMVEEGTELVLFEAPA